jgi:hypothetical protein
MTRGPAVAVCLALAGCNGVVAGQAPEGSSITLFDDTVYYSTVKSDPDSGFYVDTAALCPPRPSRCTVTLVLPPGAGGSCLHPVCDPARGLTAPPEETLARYCTDLEAKYASEPPEAGLVDPSQHSECELRELLDDADSASSLAHDCVTSPEPGWCYVAGVGRCPQTIILSPAAHPEGTTVHITCTAL